MGTVSLLHHAVSVRTRGKHGDGGVGVAICGAVMCGIVDSVGGGGGFRDAQLLGLARIDVNDVSPRGLATLLRHCTCAAQKCSCGLREQAYVSLRGRIDCGQMGWQKQASGFRLWFHETTASKVAVRRRFKLSFLAR